MKLLHLWLRSHCRWVWLWVSTKVTYPAFIGMIGACGGFIPPLPPPAHATPPPERFVPFSGLPPEMTRYRLPSVWAPPVGYVPFERGNENGMAGKNFLDRDHNNTGDSPVQFVTPSVLFVVPSPPLDAPEPAAVLVLLSGLLGVWVLRRWG